MKKHLLTTLSLFLAIVAYGQCPTGETEVTMTIITDAYGSETEWEITGAGGSPVYSSGGPYADQTAAGEFPQTPVSFCVPDGTVLTVTVTDDYDDGMCCTYGNGSWALSVGGTDLVSGSEFGSTDVASVVVGGTDLGIQALDVPSIVAPGNTTVSGTVINSGTESITGFTLDYTIDNGTPVQQVFSATVAVGGTAPFSFTTQWNATGGSHSIDLDLSGVSGDVVAANNSLSKDVVVPSQLGTRLPLLEQFTSSTCIPCNTLNNINGFVDLLEGLNPNSQSNAEIALIKYQYDFPLGGDHAYNSEVGDRVFGFYFSSSIGIPEVLVDADLSPNSFAVTAPSILAYGNEPAVIDISATHTITNGNEITVDVTVDPYVDLNATLQIALVEKHYDATNHNSFTNGETEFFHIFRKMISGSNGTSLNLTGGTQYTTQKSYTATINSNLPSQGSFDFHAGSELEVVVFVQGSDLTIYNSAISTGSSQLTGLRDYDDNTAIGVYPNPATSDQLNVVVETIGNADGILTVTDLKGALVLSESLGKLVAGTNRHAVNIQSLKTGMYNVNVMTNGHIHSARVMVQK
jgi:ribosomal protein S11